MPSPQLRLVLFVAALAALGAAALVLSPVSEQGLRDALEPLGVAGPLAFILLSAVLGSVFVPGPLLAGASGLLFGTLTGFFVTLAAATLGATVAVAVARRAGHAGVQELEHPRVRAVGRLLRQHAVAVAAVVVQRLAPALPDAPFSYLFGLAGVRAWQVALGTVVGAAPRAFSYVALGDAVGTRSGPLAAVAVGTLAATAAVGAVVLAVAVRRTRRP